MTSSPVIVNGIVYVGSRDHNLYAIDAATGALLWNFTDFDNNWVSSTPAVADGIVYIGGYRNKVYALDAMTGALTLELYGTITLYDTDRREFQPGCGKWYRLYR